MHWLRIAGIDSHLPLSDRLCISVIEIKLLYVSLTISWVNKWSQSIYCTAVISLQRERLSCFSRKLDNITYESLYCVKYCK